MTAFKPAALVLATAFTLGLSACGGSNNSASATSTPTTSTSSSSSAMSSSSSSSSSNGGDVSDVSSGAMIASDLPAGFTLGTAATADTLAAYQSSTLGKPGQLGSCAGSTIPIERKSFTHGMIQVALDSAKLGIKDCVETMSSDSAALAVFNDGQSKVSKQAHFVPSTLGTVGDGSFAGALHTGNGPYLHVVGFRHGNALISLVSYTTKDTITDAEMHKIAENINNRLQ